VDTLLFQQGEHPTWKSWDLTNVRQKWVSPPASKSRTLGAGKGREQAQHSGIRENVVPRRWPFCSQAVRATLHTRSNNGCRQGMGRIGRKRKSQILQLKLMGVAVILQPQFAKSGFQVRVQSHLIMVQGRP